MLARGEDNAMMRFALGSKYSKTGDADRAVEHLSVAVSLEPDYSAAWKLLGKVQAEAALGAEVMEIFRTGIEAAGRRGDQQAAREMQVFLKRFEKTE